MPDMNPTAALEQQEGAPAPDGGAPAGDDTYSFKYPLSGKTVVLPKKIGAIETKDFLEDVIGQSNGKFRKEYRTQIDELTQKAATAETLQARIDELELKLLPEEARKAKELENNLKKQESTLKLERDTVQKLTEQLKGEKLGNAISAAASTTAGDLVSPEDAVTLFRAQCSPALVQDGETFKAIAKIDGEEMDISEAWNKWLSSPSKAHLLKNQLSPGGGSAGGQRSSNQSNTMKRENYDRLPSEQQIELAKKGNLKLT